MHRFFPNFSLFTVLAAFVLLTACRSPQVSVEDISVNINSDGETLVVALPAGSTVTQALQSTGITIGNLDKAEPPLYTVLSDGDSVTLIRVQEKFETEEVIMNFLDANPTFKLEPFVHPLTGEQTDGQMQIWPWEGPGDGMFIARIIRDAE